MAITIRHNVTDPWRPQTGTVYQFEDGWKAFIVDSIAHICWIYLFEPEQQVNTGNYRAQYCLESWNERGGYPPRAHFTDTNAESHGYIHELALATHKRSLEQLSRAVKWDVDHRR